MAPGRQGTPKQSEAERECEPDRYPTATTNDEEAP